MKGKTDKGKEFLNENFSYLHNDWALNRSEYEFAYFRKCWNIRTKFFEYFPPDKPNNSHTYLTIGDLITVIEKVLKYFLDEENWDRGESIWDWHIQVAPIAKAIKDLRFFLIDVEAEGIKNKDIEIYFYDSY